MAVLDKITTAIGKAFNAQKKLFYPDATIELLAVSDTTNQFVVITDVDSGWFFDYSALRLSVATTDTDFGSLINQSTNIRINEEIYTIRSADTIARAGTNPVWEIVCERELRSSNFRNAY